MVPFYDLAALHAEIRLEIDDAISRVLGSGTFVLGEEVAAFEAEFAAYVGAAECVTVGNGLDAITLALTALGIGPGDEVLVPSHTFIATWIGVTRAGATPVPVEPREGTFLMDPAAAAAAVTPRTKAVLPVHLYGAPADLPALSAMCEQHGLLLLEDAAQAHGAQCDGRRIGSTGTATWSFYPGKNLGCLGDGGAVTTTDGRVAERIRRLRNYGSSRKYVHDEIGMNSRLDEIQAAVLRVKLAHLENHNRRRQRVAELYLDALVGCGLTLPQPTGRDLSAWHLFVIQSDDRDSLQRELSARGVQTQVHYPLAVHQQRAYAPMQHSDDELPLAARYAARVLSLPIGPTVSEADVDSVVAAVRESVRPAAALT